jgi:adenosylcobinamide kinase/adenosylcobinamide-phosphate guanylyltransferase
VLGGARSGKSAYAERLLEAGEGALVYLATGQARDAEMAERIARHRARRGPRWRTVEAPLDLAMTLQTAGAPVLLDCLTLWLSNRMAADGDLDAAEEELLAALGKARLPMAVVSNEVGLGIVPANALARAFQDRLGRLNQRVAALADRVVFLAAGLPLVLKDQGAA